MAMKIAIISKSTAQGGGASRIAENLALWLVEEGHHVDHFCAHLPTKRYQFQKPLFPRSILARGLRKMHSVTRRLGFNEILPIEYGIQLMRLIDRYDVVHFHDHFRAFSPITMLLAGRRVPTFFTAHDCLHFTGGCNSPMECSLYQTRCGRCPQLAAIGAFDVTGFNQSVHRMVARSPHVRYVYPSHWLLGEARKALQFGTAPAVIPNGFDVAPYAIRTRKVARQLLGLPADRLVVCISADYLSDARKGAQYALNSLVSIHDLAPIVILVGRPLPDVEAVLRGIPHWFSAYVESRERLGLLYAAADVLLYCSLADNLPITVQESMAARTPIVGFATGGIPEMVQDGISAWLVPPRNQDQLNSALREALSSDAVRFQRGEAARQALVKFSKETCVRAHLAMYAGEL
jgi:glycosyltransferase involved in cell wall biosynthesis